MVLSLASQAAVSLENNLLYQEIETLFEGFVKASVQAIESRDPTTSGHSNRVAVYTVSLAKAVDKTTSGSYRGVSFTPEHLKEIRYASLLHDFGKVGVREHVLVKAKKLYPDQLKLVKTALRLHAEGDAVRPHEGAVRLPPRAGAGRVPPLKEEHRPKRSRVSGRDRTLPAGQSSTANEPDGARRGAVTDPRRDPRQDLRGRREGCIPFLTDDEYIKLKHPEGQPRRGGAQGDREPRHAYLPVPEHDPLDQGDAEHSRHRLRPPREAERQRLSPRNTRRRRSRSRRA